MLKHALIKKDGRWSCTVCNNQWASKSRTDCPGVPLYPWGKVPENLARADDLFAQGLKLAPEQKRVAVVGSARSNWVSLYERDQCVPHGIKVNFDHSKYDLIELERGFQVWRINGICIQVELTATRFVVSFPTDQYSAARFMVGLYSLGGLVDDIARSFAKRITLGGDQNEDEATQMIGRALSKRIKAQWERLLPLVDSEVRDLARLMWASVQGDATCLHHTELYTDAFKHLRADLRKYHACRMFFASLAPRDTGWFEMSQADQLRYMSDWRKHLAPAVPNKAFNKTLDKLPTGLSAGQLKRLAVMQFSRPVTDRLHLVFALCATEHHNWGLHEHVLLNATSAQVKEAAQIFGRSITSRSKIRQIGAVANLIFDYPHPYRGDLVGLARRSHEWHGTVGDRPEVGLAPEAPLVMPNGIDLAELESKGIHILRTAGDCYQEGSTMRHCVSSYASKAASGQCYLFHVEHKAFKATIEVSPGGHVVQAYGPANSKNAACDYGIQVLQEAWREQQKAQPAQHG